MNLLNSISKGTFLSVYDQTEPDGTFHICRYLEIDDTFALFQAISTRGYDDGFYLIRSDYIYRIDVDDEYTSRIKKLFELQNQPYYDKSAFNEGPLLIGLLSYAKEDNLIISVFLEDGENITGRINTIDINNEVICIDKLTEDGNCDGSSFVELNVVEKIICNSGVERCIEMLGNSIFSTKQVNN